MNFDTITTTTNRTIHLFELTTNLTIKYLEKAFAGNFRFPIRRCFGSAEKITARAFSFEVRMINRFCIECGKDFLIKPSQLKRHKNAGRFCSLKCKSSFGGQIAAKISRKAKIKKVCEICKKLYEVRPVHHKSKYCSMACSSISQKQKFKGKKNPNYKNKGNNCIICNKYTHNKLYCSRSCMKSDNARKTPLLKAIRASAKYKKWRKQVFERDKYKCVQCKNCDDLHADHIYAFVKIIFSENIQSRNDAYKSKRLWDITNGQTLCFKCHKKTDSYGSSWYLSKARNAQPTLFNF